MCFDYLRWRVRSLKVPTSVTVVDLDGPIDTSQRVDRVRAVVRGAVTFHPGLGDVTPEVNKLTRGAHVNRVHVLPHEVMSTAL